MKYFKLKIISKNKESLSHFYDHLFFRTDLNRNFTFLQKNLKFSNSKKRLTILKAPHVYKTAQEQFEIRNFQRQFIIQTTNSKKFLKYIKNLKLKKFSNVNLIISTISNKKFFESNNLTDITYFFLKYFKINSCCYSLTTKTIASKTNNFLTQKYLISLDMLGEFHIKYKLLFG